MSGGRNAAIDNSPFRDEIRALLKDKGYANKPTYAEVQEQIEQRYGEEYSVRQLRDYMNKEITPDERMPPAEAQKEIEKKRETIDIAAKRQDLATIQENRMEQTLKTEEQMDGLVLDQASDMIKLFDQILDSLSKDYERLGILESTTDIQIDMTQVQADPFAEMIESTVNDEMDAEDDEHYDYQEVRVEGGKKEDDGSLEEGEEGEDVILDKDAEEIDFDDLPDDA